MYNYNRAKPKLRRVELWKGQNEKCFYCGVSVLLENTTLDHLIPKSRRGGNLPNNLVVSCPRCNSLLADFLSFDDVVEKLWYILGIKEKAIKDRGLDLVVPRPKSNKISAPWRKSYFPGLDPKKVVAVKERVLIGFPEESVQIVKPVAESKTMKIKVPASEEKEYEVLCGICSKPVEDAGVGRDAVRCSDSKCVGYIKIMPMPQALRAGGGLLMKEVVSPTKSAEEAFINLDRKL